MISFLSIIFLCVNHYIANRLPVVSAHHVYDLTERFLSTVGTTIHQFAFVHPAKVKYIKIAKCYNLMHLLIVLHGWQRNICQEALLWFKSLGFTLTTMEI